MIGTEDQQRQLAVKRLEIRDIVGDKIMREITLKQVYFAGSAAFAEMRGGGTALSVYCAPPGDRQSPSCD